MYGSPLTAQEDERYDPKTHRLLAEVPAPAQLGTVVPPSLGYICTRTLSNVHSNAGILETN